MEFKYVIFKNRSYQLFSHGIQHNSVANADDVVSAGFCQFIHHTTKGTLVHCYGYSESLSTPQRRVESRGEKDALIIQKIAENAVGMGAE